MVSALLVADQLYYPVDLMVQEKSVKCLLKFILFQEKNTAIQCECGSGKYLKFLAGGVCQRNRVRWRGGCLYPVLYD